MSDIKYQYGLYKSSKKKDIYNSNIHLYWSNQLKRWICTNPRIIQEILLHPHCHVVSHEVSKIEDRFNIDLEHVKKLTTFLPVTQDDLAHKELRKKMALIIQKNSPDAVNFISREVDKKINLLFYSKNKNRFDLHLDFIMPICNKFAQIVAGVNIDHELDIESLSTIFDETLSVDARKHLNQSIENILLRLHLESKNEDDNYLKIALMALGKDSLISSLSESIISTLLKNPNKLLSEIDWARDIPASGVPVIERVASEDFVIDNVQIKAGHRFRLYIDASGYVQESCPHHSAMYFGAGPHTCLGMSLAKKVWLLLVAAFQKIDKNISILKLKPKAYDNVFRLYENIEVMINE
jgi:hypothetical protein